MTKTVEAERAKPSLNDDAPEKLVRLLAADELDTSMFAVVKATRGASMELRIVDVDQNENTKGFDQKLLESGFSEFVSQEARYATFEESLELKGAIGILPFSEINESLADENLDSSKFPITKFVADIAGARSAYLRNEIPYLAKDEVEKTVGLVFAYSCAEVPDPIYAYQKVPPSHALKKSSFLYKLEGGSNFKLFTDESIRIGLTFDFVIVDNAIIAARPSTISSQFEYGMILQKHAEAVVGGLEHLVDGADQISARVLKNRKRTINKLLKIRNSPVMSMTPSSLRTRLENEELYKGKFAFDDEDRVIVDEGNVEDVLKMLNDELLRSPLTDAVYESEIKSRFVIATS